MNHAVTVRAQHGKIRSNIVSHGDALLQRANRFEMMRLDKTIADSAIALWKAQITGLSACAVEFFSRPRRGAIALNFAVKGVFAGLDNGR